MRAAKTTRIAKKQNLSAKNQSWLIPVSYTHLCNATETLLVHKDIALNLLPALKRELDNVTLLGCEETRRIIDAAPASEQDWQTEYLDYKLSIRIIHSDVYKRQPLHPAMQYAPAITRYGQCRKQNISEISKRIQN